MYASNESIQTEKLAQAATLVAFEQLSKKYDGLTYQKKLTQKQIPGNIGSCCPDGGIFFLNGMPVLAVEAKHQENKGNAIERWYKNAFIMRAINPDVAYITFATGEGTIIGGTIWRILSIAHKGEYNVIRPNDNTAYLTIDPLTIEEMVTIIVNAFEASTKE
jgi:hypothetical protein